MYKLFTTHWHRRLARTALAASLFALGACSDRAAGPAITEVRGVDAFHSIDLRGAADLEIAAGAATSLAITADAATLKNTTTTVRNGLLVIDIRTDWLGLRSSGKVTVRLATPILNSLSVHGAGNVRVNGISGTGLALALQGAGNVEAAGATDALNARINGAGNMDLSRLIAGDATVAVNGAGKLQVHATGSLEAQVNGVGSISYAGPPQRLDTRINGVGSITPAR
jgi:Putative auto-transporter adhesin, head GIN domain